jgi:hypothetical protein
MAPSFAAASPLLFWSTARWAARGPEEGPGKVGVSRRKEPSSALESRFLPRRGRIRRRRRSGVAGRRLWCYVLCIESLIGSASGGLFFCQRVSLYFRHLPGARNRGGQDASRSRREHTADRGHGAPRRPEAIRLREARRHRAALVGTGSPCAGPGGERSRRPLLPKRGLPPDRPAPRGMEGAAPWTCRRDP